MYRFGYVYSMPLNLVAKQATGWTTIEVDIAGGAVSRLEIAEVVETGLQLAVRVAGP
jgi:hypothetical protein